MQSDFCQTILNFNARPGQLFTELKIKDANKEIEFNKSQIRNSVKA